jgi:hypothetical protein
MVNANAKALQPTDKIIFTPEGVVPTLVLPGPGIMPTVDTGVGANTAPNVQPEPADESETTVDAEAEADQ